MDQVREGEVHKFNAVGYAPIATQKGKTFDLKMLDAIKSSKIDAYKELAEQIYGVALTSQSTVADTKLQKDWIKTEVNGVVKGAKVTRSYHDSDLYISEIELDLNVLPTLKLVGFNEKKVAMLLMLAIQLTTNFYRECKKNAVTVFLI
ncbi:MAG TPA: hypothetical protein EYH12_02925 [Psychromonas hadalis]|nr:hypothetical protein [Psychromonas hadalis]